MPAYAPESSSEIERYLNFRVYLREHPTIAHACSDLKRSLTRQCNDDMRCYSDGMTVFSRKIDQRAAIWQRESRFTRRPYDER